MTAKPMSYKELEELHAALEEQLKRTQEGGHLYKWFQPEGPFSYDNYPKHMAFFAGGTEYRERLFMAANRVGKSIAGAYEATCHATGEYPEWWEGKRFDNPTDGWCAGDTGQTTRDILQDVLFGYPSGALGTGMVPGRLIMQVRRRAGIPDAFDTVRVRHVSGEDSIIGFKSYDQGRRSFQGTGKDWVWLDEECPQDVYNECLLRTMTTDGIVYVTFTPLSGMTQFIQDFMKDAFRKAVNPEMII
jgi:phage terminase large subunit-like protein